ncbi:hypothetical protein MIR68_007952 [Amoeboaphelidium protococcarum]|nr:hypothetical protein MIR68_007952 [Amoeboaphelidium protococcarum]
MTNMDNELNALLLPKQNQSYRHRNLKYIRWIVLLLACLLLFGNYYCYDIPAALNVQLRQYIGHPYDEWQFEFNSLYTAYSFPNLILPIFGGIMVDRMDSNRILLIFSVLVLFGTSLFTVGSLQKLYWVMIVGRALFGIAGESLEVAQAKITTDWFRDHSLGLALGFNLTVARLATALNDIISPAIFSSFNLASALWFGTITCLFSLLCGLLLAWINGKYYKFIDKEKDYTYYDDKEDSVDCLGLRKDESVSTLCSTGVIYQTQSGNCVLQQQQQNDDDDDSSNSCSVMKSDDDSCASEQTMQDSPQSESIEGSVHLRDLFQLPLSFWILCLTIIAYYGAVNPFIHILSDLLQLRWYHDDVQTAGKVMAIPDVVSAVGSPICGWLLDVVTRRRFGSQVVRSIFLPISGLLLVLVHYLIGFTNVDPRISLFILGTSYSIFGASMWPLVPHLVKNSAFLGTAYGISTVAMNVALTFVPLVIAKILATNSYREVSMFFIALSSVGVLLSIMVGIVDFRCRVNSS